MVVNVDVHRLAERLGALIVSVDHLLVLESVGKVSGCRLPTHGRVFALLHRQLSPHQFHFGFASLMLGALCWRHRSKHAPLGLYIAVYLSPIRCTDLIVLRLLLLPLRHPCFAHRRWQLALSFKFGPERGNLRKRRFLSESAGAINLLLIGRCASCQGEGDRCRPQRANNGETELHAADNAPARPPDARPRNRFAGWGDCR